MATTALVRRSSTPRIGALVLVLALASLLLLPGCWVYSVSPLYEENLAHPDTDLAFDQSLVGSWWNADKECTWTLIVKGQQKEMAYELTFAAAPECKTDEGEKRVIQYDGHAVKLDNHLFLDVNPKSADVCDLCLPLHSFFLISQQNDTLALTPVDGDWLKEAMEQKKVILAHLNDDIVLSASSKDLKAFVRQYADDKAAFKPDPSLTFKRK
ncbi:MAG: hypothetical protein ACLPVW_04500 [Terriglobales bacterium]|jgi:hypothetical protein